MFFIYSNDWIKLKEYKNHFKNYIFERPELSVSKLEIKTANLDLVNQINAILKLSSGETRKVSSKCTATIGVVSNPDQKNIKIGKAGRNRWRGKSPQTRGVAMNPVDHPHGGGEGKTSGGRSQVSPWGQSAKGLKTRRPQRSDKFIITRRKKRK